MTRLLDRIRDDVLFRGVLLPDGTIDVRPVHYRGPEHRAVRHAQRGLGAGVHAVLAYALGVLRATVLG